MHTAGTGGPERLGDALGRRQFLQGVAATGLAAGAGGLLAACGSGSSPAAAPHVVRQIRRHGGNLKLGLAGGDAGDTLDPHDGLTYLDLARAQSLYSPLVQLNAQARGELVLAESIEPRHGSASEWVIRLRRGVTFHDGQELTAADVIYTFRRIIGSNYTGSAGLGPVEPARLKALDRHTVLVRLTPPLPEWPSQLEAFWHHLYIVPAGFDPRRARPNGTGPFRFQSFTPGQRSVFTRNPHYFRPGLPYADTLTIIDFPDAASLQKALVSNVIQGAGTLGAAQVAALRGQSGVRVVVSPAGALIPFTMRVDRPPFNDVRVRQAMRLLVDRPQLVSSALGGHGAVASDVFSPHDPDFDSSLRREQDIGQAKSLLKKAGRADLAVQLVTSAIATGTTAMARALAQQARAAGVTIHVKNISPGQFFSPNHYLRSAFSQDYYGTSPYLGQVAYSMLVTSPFNETHTDNPRYSRLYVAASTAADAARRKEILHEMQRFDFEQGGYIIPAFVDSLDAYSTKITGYTPAKVGQPLSNFGFEQFSFTG
jgi:peptide/nickel transport system substrate-binding protein